MDFQVLGPVRNVETIAAGRAIREPRRLRRFYGSGRWRKRKDVATPARVAVCVKNKGYEASLEVGKLYRVIPDREAESHGYLSIVDESGEDYGYAADRFFVLDAPKPLERALIRGAS